jgi:hypothetical protein
MSGPEVTSRSTKIHVLGGDAHLEIIPERGKLDEKFKDKQNHTNLIADLETKKLEASTTQRMNWLRVFATTQEISDQTEVKDVLSVQGTELEAQDPWRERVVVVALVDTVMDTSVASAIETFNLPNLETWVLTDRKYLKFHMQTKCSNANIRWFYSIGDLIRQLTSANLPKITIAKSGNSSWSVESLEQLQNMFVQADMYQEAVPVVEMQWENPQFPRHFTKAHTLELGVHSERDLYMASSLVPNGTLRLYVKGVKTRIK